MSTEVETKYPTAPAPEGRSVASTEPASNHGAPWRRRRYQIAAGLVAIAVIAAVTANGFLARQYSPDGAVRQYLAALQSGDAATAWAEIQISAPTQPVAAALLDEAALQAAFAQSKPDVRSFDITSTTVVDASSSLVAFSYQTSSGTKQYKFLVERSGQRRFGLYPVWQLVVPPAVLQVTVPAGSGGLAVDGKALDLAVGASYTLALLPVVHKIEFKASQMLTAQAIKVDATFSAGRTVNYQPKLTPAGAAEAQGAIAAYLAGCGKQIDLSPNGCPQSYSNPFIGSGTWQLVGDPTRDLALNFDQNLNPTATGHFQMVISYQEAGIDGVNHWPSSGGYKAALALTASDVSVISVISAKDLPGLQRPDGATDQAAKDLVTKAFGACAAAKSASPADCPQGLAFTDVTNVSWALSGDPLAGATVTFDQATGLLTVKGKFSMTSTYYVNGYSSGRPSYTTSFEAYLLWNGQALQLVTIAGDF